MVRTRVPTGVPLTNEAQERRKRPQVFLETLEEGIKKEQAKVDAAGRGIKFLAALAMPDDLKNRMN